MAVIIIQNDCYHPDVSGLTKAWFLWRPRGPMLARVSSSAELVRGTVLCWTTTVPCHRRIFPTDSRGTLCLRICGVRGV